jgi:hypothetical protein
MSGGGRQGELRYRDAGPVTGVEPGDHNRAARRAKETIQEQEARIARQLEQAHVRREAKWEARSKEPHTIRDMALIDSLGGADPVILELLELAVPFWVVRMLDTTPEDRERRAHELATVMMDPAQAALADIDITPAPGGRAHMFNALAEGLAIGSFLPDGVTFSGVRWENTPEGLKVTKVI